MAIVCTRIGQIPEERGVEGTCGKCSSRFHWLRRDGEHHDDQREGEWSTIRCTLCGAQVIGRYLKED